MTPLSRVKRPTLSRSGANQRGRETETVFIDFKFIVGQLR